MINRILLGRALRSFADGLIAVVLPAYLLALGMGQLEVGVISTATLLGSAFMTLAIGRWGNRFSIRWLLLVAALLMAATGIGFAGFSAFWPLLVVAFFGTLNPSSGDASVFMPLDHTMLAMASDRTGVFARYSFLGSIAGAVGALCAGLPEWLGARLSILDALRLMFVLYAAVGIAVWLLYLGLPAKLGAKGVEEIVSIALTEEEQTALQKSAASVRELVTALKGFDRNLERAAMSAGAGPLRTFFWVTLPVLRPGILVGALFAFLHSFNEAVVAIFIAGRDASTLPKKMFEAIRLESDPVIADFQLYAAVLPLQGHAGGFGLSVPQAVAHRLTGNL